MYDWPEVRDDTDRFWNAIARHFGTGIALSRPDDHTAAWRRADLLFSQTCGYPFTHEFAGQLRYVATPHYAAEGCGGANYASMVFARRAAAPEDFRGAVAAVNAADSMSGMLALKLVFAPLARGGRFFGRSIMTGGHIASLKAVREGRADVCAVDAVCVGLARRYRPDYLTGLVEIARSPAVPGLPFVTRSDEPAALREALRMAFADRSLDEARERLLLAGFSVLDPVAYDAILDHEKALNAAGGLDLS